MSDYSQDRNTDLPDRCEQYSIPAGDLSYYDEDEVFRTMRVDDAGLLILPGCSESSLYMRPELFRKDPFYGSVTPISYTAAATCVMSWLLLILLLLSQKKRPWLQKMALSLMAATLTASLAATTSKLEDQYNHGYQDADELRMHVFGGLPFKILRVLSGIGLWMAHVQVAVRLVSKGKEELLIKGIGGLLIVLDLIFACLSDFLDPVYRYQDRFHSPLYVISQVLEILIVVAYAMVIVLYAFRKRRFAFNRRIWGIAFLSVTAVLSPLAFTIMSISNYWLAGWSSMASRVCSAAATVVVWDWVDAIERLEHEEQKKAFMGRKLKPRKSDADNTESHHRPKFPLAVFRRHWIIERGGSAASSGVATEYNLDIRSSRPPTNSPPAQSQSQSQPPPPPTPPPPPPPLPRSGPSEDNLELDRTSTAGSASSGEDTSSGFVVHHHPVKRSNLRITSIAREEQQSHSPETSQRQNTIDEGNDDGDDSGSELYVVHSHRQHPPTQPGYHGHDHDDDDGLPPDFFAPVHGFQPGDYYDEKAPIDDTNEPGPSTR